MNESVSTKAVEALWTILESFGFVDSAGGAEWQRRFPELVQELQTMDSGRRAEVSRAAFLLVAAMAHPESPERPT